MQPKFKPLLAAFALAFAMSVAAPVGSPIFVGEAHAKAKKGAKKKDKPGKCGTMKYYDKKKKACASKG